MWLFFLLLFLLLLLKKLFIQQRNVRRTSSIPKVIHKVYIDHSMELPDILPTCIKEAHASWVNLNPSYTLKYYSGNDCIKYLHTHFGPKHVQMFNQLNAYSAKCDFFRYCVTYHQGGVYSDWKQICLTPLDSFIHNDWDFFAFNDLGNNFSKSNSFQSTGFFGAIQGHPILKKAIQLCTLNVDRRFYGKTPLDPTYLPLSIAIRDVPAKRTSVIGFFRKGYYYLHNSSTQLVLNKSRGSGLGQHWVKGNNYNTLWFNKTFYKK